MRRVLILFLNFLTFMSIYGEVRGDSIPKKRTRELNINSTLVIPIYYNFRFTDSYDFFNIKPDFKLAASFGLQYKSRHNILFEFQFQHYQFSYTSPIYGINNGLKYGNRSDYYYDIIKYGQYRNALGIGKHITINTKNALGIVIGLALFTPDHKNEYTTTYSDLGILSSTHVTKKNYLEKVFSYCNIRYSHSLNKRLAVIGDINQSLGIYRSSSWPEFRYIHLSKQYLLSINIGVKFILINK